MERNINLGDAPEHFEEKAQASLVRSDFEAFVWDKGYDVYHDKMIYCPCKQKDNTFLIGCRNCRGTGYVLVERNETKMVLQSMNLETKFKEWSEEKLGTVRITALERESLSNMDRIIVLDAETIDKQIIYPTLHQNKLFAFLYYEATIVEKCFLWQSVNESLLELVEGIDFTTEDGMFFLDDKFKISPLPKYQVSLKYKHRPQFHILDMVRDITKVKSLEANLSEGQVNFPISAIGRRSHYVLDRDNYSKTLLIDNTKIEED